VLQSQELNADYLRLRLHAKEQGILEEFFSADIYLNFQNTRHSCCMRFWSSIEPM